MSVQSVKPGTRAASVKPLVSNCKLLTLLAFLGFPECLNSGESCGKVLWDFGVRFLFLVMFAILMMKTEKTSSFPHPKIDRL